MKKKSVLISLGLFLLSCPLMAQQKFGVVDVNAIYPLMPEYRKGDSILMAYNQTLSDDYKKQEDELYAAMEKFTRDSASLSPAIKEYRRQELQKYMTLLESRKDEMSKMLEAKKLELENGMRNQLSKAIEAVAKEKGYSLLLYKDAVAYQLAADDVTRLVIGKLGIK